MRYLLDMILLGDDLLDEGGDFDEFFDRVFVHDVGQISLVA